MKSFYVKIANYVPQCKDVRRIDIPERTRILGLIAI